MFQRIAVLCLLFVANLTATPLTGLGNNVNALLFGNLNGAGGDTEGRLFVGGNATFPNSYGVGTAVIGAVLPPSSVRDDLVVLGNVITASNWGVNGNAVYGGTLSGPGISNLSPGATTRQQASITFDPVTGNARSDGTGLTMGQLFAEAGALSSALGAMADQGVVTKQAQFSTLTLVGNHAGLNVFNVTAAEFNNSTVDVTAPAGSTVLINITGASPNISGGAIFLNGVNRDHVLYNFSQATSLSLGSRSMEGSMLAPFLLSATLNGGNVNGQAVLGGTITQQNGFEFHNFYFGGDFPSTSVPEPGTLGAVSLITALFVVRRLRSC